MAWCPLGGDEQLAVRALEAAIALGRTGQQLARERLLAVRADDVALVPGGFRHASQRTYGSWDTKDSTGARSGGAGSLLRVPKWTSPRTRSPSGTPSASRPARVRSTRGVRQ